MIKENVLANNIARCAFDIVVYLKASAYYGCNGT
jgi:hypothetical protein